MKYYAVPDSTVNVYSNFARFCQLFGFSPKKNEFTQRKLGNIYLASSVLNVYSTQYEAREAISRKLYMYKGQAVPIYTIESSYDIDKLKMNNKEMDKNEKLSRREKLLRAKIFRVDCYSPLEDTGISATEFKQLRFDDCHSQLHMLEYAILKLRMKSNYTEYERFYEIIQSLDHLYKVLCDYASDDYKKHDNENMQLFYFLIDKSIQLVDDIYYCSKQDPLLEHQSILDTVCEYERQINTEIKNAKDAANDNGFIKYEKIRSAIGAVIGAVAGFVSSVKITADEAIIFGFSFKKAVKDIWSETKMCFNCYKHAELSSSIFSYFNGKKTRDKYEHKIEILSTGINLFSHIKRSASKLDESRKRDKLPMPSTNDSTIEMKKRLYVTNR